MKMRTTLCSCSLALIGVFLPSSWPAAGAQEPTSVTGAQEPASVTGEEVTFTSSDDVTVFGDLHRADAATDRPIVLLLHQSASDASEYTAVVPHLLARGFHVLAVDARGGGGANRTVARLEHHGGGAEAYHDFRAALRFVRDAGFTGPIGVVGSSYSAGRIFQVLADDPSGVAAVASFSPGAGFARFGPGVPSWAEQVEVPVFMTWAPHELDDERYQRFDRVASLDRRLFIQRHGVHGASTLDPEDNPEGWRANLDALLAFLGHYLREPVPTEPLARPLLSQLRSAFQAHNLAIQDVEILELRSGSSIVWEVDRPYVVVAHGIRADGRFQGDLDDELFGVFLVSPDLQTIEVELDILPTLRWSDYVYAIEELEWPELVLLGLGATYGDDQQRLTYDLEAGSEVRQDPVPPLADRGFELIGTSFVAVQVADDRAAAEWYTGLFGLEEVHHVQAEDDRYSIRLLRGPRLLVELIRDRGAAARPGGRLLGLFKAGFYVDDIDAAFTWLGDKGVDRDPGIVIDEPLQARTVVFRDPDGNRLQFFERCDPECPR